MKKLVLCLAVILLLTVTSLAQTRKKKPVRKTALATYVTSTSSRNGGIIELKLNGKGTSVSNWKSHET